MIGKLDNPTTLLLLACAVAVATLVGAFGFQHLGGLEPCPMCIWQRWPYAIGASCIIIGFIAGRGQYSRILYGLATVTFLVGVGLSVWHAGFEYGWWPGPSNCAAPLELRGQSAQELLQTLENRQPVGCDVAPWSFAGLSLAGWSAVALALIAAGAGRACVLLRTTDPAPHPNTGSPTSSRGDS